MSRSPTIPFPRPRLYPTVIKTNKHSNSGGQQCLLWISPFATKYRDPRRKTPSVCEHFDLFCWFSAGHLYDTYLLWWGVGSAMNAIMTHIAVRRRHCRKNEVTWKTKTCGWVDVVFSFQLRCAMIINYVSPLEIRDQKVELFSFGGKWNSDDQSRNSNKVSVRCIYGSGQTTKGRNKRKDKESKNATYWRNLNFYEIRNKITL